MKLLLFETLRFFTFVVEFNVEYFDLDVMLLRLGKADVMFDLLEWCWYGWIVCEVEDEFDMCFMCLGLECGFAECKMRFIEDDALIWQVVFEDEDDDTCLRCLALLVL